MTHPPAELWPRVDEWARRTAGTQFFHMGYQEAMDDARAGDLIYCDRHTAILKPFCTARRRSISRTSSR